MFNKILSAQHDSDAEEKSGFRRFDLQRSADPPAPGDPPADPPAPPAAPPSDPPASPPAPPTDPPAAPEKYENFTLPEGAAYDQALHDQFSTVARKYGLTQEAAQEFVTMYAGIRQNEQAALLAEHEKRVEEWAKETKADPVIAKNFDKNLAGVKEVFTRFGGQEMLDLLESTGLGSHPQFIRMGMAIRAKIGEDDFPDGKGGTGDQSIGQIFFPNSK